MLARRKSCLAIGNFHAQLFTFY